VTLNLNSASRNLPSQRPSKKVKIGLVAGGLGTYWPQFPNLLPQLQESSRYVAHRISALDVELIDVGFVSDAQEGMAAAEKLRAAGCDLIITFLTTYMTSSMIIPIAQRGNTAILLINLQPTEQMDHANFDTGAWLAYCGACPLPEMANAFERSGVPFRSVSGFLHEERAWLKIENWIQAASIKSILQNSRHGIMGHLYPGMLDVSTDMTMVSSYFGGHMEVLEFDDLRVRVEKVSKEELNRVLATTREIFEIDKTVRKDDLEWAGKVAVGLQRMVDDFDISSLAYYHRGLDDEIHERLGAGMILGCSLLTAQGVPAVGEYELRTSIGMLILDRMGAGGSFTEFQALNFNAGVVELGHDGPAHLAISNGRPTLRGLGVYHGKRGAGVSVEFDVTHGPVTVFGVTQRKNGTYEFVASEGEVVEGPRLKIGNTTSLVDFGMNPGEWCDQWSATGVPHHWALGTGHRINELKSISELLNIELKLV
jgi:L-arabinose isomerase